MSEKYIFFWQAKEKSNEITKACLSQWYISSFKVDNIKYFCAEQYMMSQKALLFNDLDTYNKIMNSHHQNECKKLGREIKNFDHEKWDKNKFDIVITGNIHKFQQNEQLKNYLLSTNKKILVEASPYDKIWGIGMAETDKNILDESKWKGSNLLGKALMKVRDILNQDILYQEKKIPKIICMMITSFDGRAKGKYLFDQGIVRQGLINFFIEFHRIPHQGDIYGSHTMKEAYCKGEVDLTKYKNNNIIIPKEDWISPNKNLDYYIFTFDRKGDINYSSCNFDGFEWMKCPEIIGKCMSHAVEILLESVSNEYLQFLREKGVSYFFAGKDEFDFNLALEKMKKLLNVNCVILGGGPTINGLFFERDLVDEVNLVICNCTGDNENEGIFGNKTKFVEFDLLDVKQFEGGSVLLKYRKKLK